LYTYNVRRSLKTTFLVGAEVFPVSWTVAVHMRRSESQTETGSSRLRRSASRGSTLT